LVVFNCKYCAIQCDEAVLTEFMNNSFELSGARIRKTALPKSRIWPAMFRIGVNRARPRYLQQAESVDAAMAQTQAVLRLAGSSPCAGASDGFSVSTARQSFKPTSSFSNLHRQSLPDHRA
jgi:hypothetical protein